MNHRIIETMGFFVLLLTVLLGSPAQLRAGENSDQLVDLSGLWEVQYVTTAQTKLPLIGTFDTTTRAILTAEVSQRGSELRITTRVCTLDLENDLPMADTIVPRRFVESLPEIERRAELRRRDTHLELRVYPSWEQVGVRLADPASDEMPEDGSHPRVFDQDGDGNPGVTIRIEGIINGEIYVIRRGWDAWLGRVEDEDTIRGGIRWHTEQVVVGASRRLLRSQPEATPHPRQSKNIFRMTRVDGEPPC